MDKFVEMVPNWSEELFGFNQGTFGVLIGLVLLGFIARLDCGDDNSKHVQWFVREKFCR